MAKVSMINRELKRAKTVKKYAAKRAALKAQIRDLSLSDEERWDAQMKLQKLPRNASPCRQVRRCQLCLLYTSPSPRDGLLSRMPSSA